MIITLTGDAAITAEVTRRFILPIIAAHRSGDSSLISIARATLRRELTSALPLRSAEEIAAAAGLAERVALATLEGEIATASDRADKQAKPRNEEDLCPDCGGALRHVDMRESAMGDSPRRGLRCLECPWGRSYEQLNQASERERTETERTPTTRALRRKKIESALLGELGPNATMEALESALDHWIDGSRGKATEMMCERPAHGVGCGMCDRCTTANRVLARAAWSRP